MAFIYDEKDYIVQTISNIKILLQNIIVHMIYIDIV